MKHRKLCLALAAVTLLAPVVYSWANDVKKSASSKLGPRNDTVKVTTTKKKLSEAETKLVHQVFSSRLLEIAAEYTSYTRVDQTVRWSPLLCDAPPIPPKNQGTISTSRAKSAHGKKLYHLYAKKHWEYKKSVWGLSRTGAAQPRAPLGQILVKEAWNPVRSTETDRKTSDAKPKPAADASKSAKPETKKLIPFALDDGVKYHAGDKKGLFIMYKMLESTPGTDRGWVYGTVTADGKKVTSVGLVENCMSCHEDAKNDRQIGVPDLYTRPTLRKRK